MTAKPRSKRLSPNQIKVLRELANGNRIEVHPTIFYAGCLEWADFPSKGGGGNLNVATLYALETAGLVGPAITDRLPMDRGQEWVITEAGKQAIEAIAQGKRVRVKRDELRVGEVPLTGTGKVAE